MVALLPPHRRRRVLLFPWNFFQSLLRASTRRVEWIWPAARSHWSPDSFDCAAAYRRTAYLVSDLQEFPDSHHPARCPVPASSGSSPAWKFRSRRRHRNCTLPTQTNHRQVHTHTPERNHRPAHNTRKTVRSHYSNRNSRGKNRRSPRRSNRPNRRRDNRPGTSERFPSTTSSPRWSREPVIARRTWPSDAPSREIRRRTPTSCCRSNP